MKYLQLLLLSSLLLISCREHPATGLSVTTIAKGMMPALAKDANNNIHVVYGSGDSILYVFSNDNGVSFSTPVLVDTLTNLVASATRGPQITATKDGIAIIAANNEGNIFSYYKNETGKWSKAGKINDADTTAKEGFLGLSSDGQNNLFAVWPDVRNDKQNKIYGARSNDGGKTWSKNIMVYTSPDSTVCECCKPSVVMKDKQVYVMFRNWLNGNRDLYIIKSLDAGNTFGEAEKLGKGNWPLNGCPMDGGSIVINSNGAAQTVWRRENKIYSCEPGAAEKEIAEGKNCTMETINNKNIYAFTNNGNIYCLFPDGQKHLLGKGSLPLLKSVSDNQVICIWQKDDEICRGVLQL